MSHNAPFRNRNVYICAYFFLLKYALLDIWLLHCVICEVGLLENTTLFWDNDSHTIDFFYFYWQQVKGYT